MTNYTYIADINAFISSNGQSNQPKPQANNNKKKNEINSGKTEKEEKKSRLPIIIILLILGICLISLIIGSIYFYKKKFSNKEDIESGKDKSDSSYDSQISTISEKSDSIELNNKDLSPSPILPLDKNKQKRTKQSAHNWLKLDEDI